MLLGELLSVIFGYLSTVAFLFVCIPQFYLNYKQENTVALSFYLVYLWFIGDIASVISCKIKENSYIIIYIGYFHIFFNILFLVQILYYRHYNYENFYQALLSSDCYSSSEYHSASEQEHIYTDLSQISHILQQHETNQSTQSNNENNNVNNNVNNNHILHQYASESNIYTKYHSFYNKIIILFNPLELYLIILSTLFLVITYNISGPLIAEILAWLSTLIFVLSRIPQIYLNYKRQSVEGLSTLAFSMLLFSNISFLLSIVLSLLDIKEHKHQAEYVLNNFQWIFGSSTSFLFDLIIVYQFVLYGELNYHYIEENE